MHACIAGSAPDCRMASPKPLLALPPLRHYRCRCLRCCCPGLPPLPWLPGTPLLAGGTRGGGAESSTGSGGAPTSAGCPAPLCLCRGPALWVLPAPEAGRHSAAGPPPQQTALLLRRLRRHRAAVAAAAAGPRWLRRPACCSCANVTPARGYMLCGIPHASGGQPEDCLRVHARPRCPALCGAHRGDGMGVNWLLAAMAISRPACQT